MPPRPKTLLRFLPPLVALAIIAVLFVLSRQPALSDHDAEDLASRFRFEKLSLSELSSNSTRTVRDVHPGLSRVSAFVSFTGAAVTLADLDGDGLPNDLVAVDPRGDLVIVAPVPGTGTRFPPFSLAPTPRPLTPSTMAPTGSLVGDFNEDGFADILVYYWGRSPVLFLQQPDSAGGSGPLSAEWFVPCELVEPFQVWYTSAATQADLDGDGHLDLIVGNYFRDGSGVLDASGQGHPQLPDSFCRALNGGRSRVFLWHGADRDASPAPPSFPNSRLGTHTPETPFRSAVVRNRVSRSAVPKQSLGTRGLVLLSPEVHKCALVHLCTCGASPDYCAAFFVGGSHGVGSPQGICAKVWGRVWNFGHSAAGGA